MSLCIFFYKPNKKKCRVPACLHTAYFFIKLYAASCLSELETATEGPKLYCKTPLFWTRRGRAKYVFAVPAETETFGLTAVVTPEKHQTQNTVELHMFCPKTQVQSIIFSQLPSYELR